MTIYSLVVLLFLFGTSLLFHVQFKLWLPDLHTGVSKGRAGGLVFPSLLEFSTVYCDPHSQRLWHSQQSRNSCFSGTLLLFWWSSGGWQLISGSSALSKTSLNIWKFTVHVLLKPGLENFEHYFTSVWDRCNCVVVWAFLALPFFGIGMKTDLFQSCGHRWVFQICWHIECSTFTASSFRIWNSSTGIPSPPLALFAVMLSKAHLTSHSKMFGSRLVITSSWLSGSWN